MPLNPNLVERRLIKKGKIPGILLDVGIAGFKINAVLAAMELGVFDELEEEELSLESLAERCNSSTRGMEVLLRTLIPLGYLEKNDGKYRLTEVAKNSLPEEDLGLMATFFQESFRRSLDAADAVREAPQDGIIGWDMVQSGEVGEAYQETMRWLASDTVDPVVDKIDLPTGAEKMMDIGGSHGLYTVRFCEENPGLEGSVIDWEIGLDNARKTLDERPEMKDRIDLVDRDFEEENLPTGFDFAFLGNIVHGLSPEGNQELFEKISNSTTENGMVAIMDQVSNPPTGRLPFDPFDTSFSRGIAAMAGFNLFLFSGGRSYEFDKLSKWLSEAGFTDVSHEPIRESPGFSLVIAEKK